MIDDTARLAALFREVGAAHHRAFAATDGEDPEWPAWYAQFLRPRLGALGWHIGRVELADHLRRIDAEHRDAGGTEAWPDYYARRLQHRLGA